MLLKLISFLNFYVPNSERTSKVGVGFSAQVLARTCVLVVGVLISHSALASEAMLKTFFKQVDTMQAVFTQKVIDETGMTLETSSGVFSLSRPGKFRWNYKSNDTDIPQGQQIIADGQSIFMYDPDLEQVTQRSLQDALGQVPSLLLVQSGANIDKHFMITDFGLTDGLSWVALKPKDENAGYQQLMIGFASGKLSAINLLDGLGNETRLSLLQVKTNIALNKGLFNFVPPEGVDVLRE